MRRIKLIIVVEGGCIRNIFTSNMDLAHNCSFELLDYDNDEEEEEKENIRRGQEIEELLKTEKLFQIY